MKLIKLALLICLVAPVCAQAHATKTIPLNENWAIDTKIPVTFDDSFFNDQFTKAMTAVRATQAALDADLEFLPNESAQEAAQVDETRYTRDIVSRETILKSEGYQVTPSRDWYVKKHAPSACTFYKGWAKGEDMAFVKQGKERRACESHMSAKYQRHTCAICGQPINAACGATATWQDGQGSHYAHADCFDAHRHQTAKEALMKNLDISDELCTSFDRQAQQRAAAQKQLADQMKAAHEQLRAKQAQEPALTVHPVTRSLKEIDRDIQRFVKRHSYSLQQAAQAKREGRTMSKKQFKLLQEFDALYNEQQRAISAQQQRAAANEQQRTLDIEQAS